MLVELETDAFKCTITPPGITPGFSAVAAEPSDYIFWILQILTLLVLNLAEDKREEFHQLSLEQKIDVVKEWIQHV